MDVTRTGDADRQYGQFHAQAHIDDGSKLKSIVPVPVQGPWRENLAPMLPAISDTSRETRQVLKKWAELTPRRHDWERKTSIVSCLVVGGVFWPW